jgi:hypothetical protein
MKEDSIEEVAPLSKEETVLSDAKIAFLRTPGANHVQLSSQALQDLRMAFRASYGENFDQDLTDEQVNKLGNLFLTILAEGLMLEVINSKLPSIEV